MTDEKRNSLEYLLCYEKKAKKKNIAAAAGGWALLTAIALALLLYGLISSPGANQENS